MALGPKLVVASLGAVNLVAGLALGIAVDRTVLLPAPSPGPPSRPHRGGRAPHGRGENGPPSADRETARLTEKLSLDPEQAEKVKAILTARREAFGEVMKDVAPRMKALREELMSNLSNLRADDE